MNPATFERFMRAVEAMNEEEIRERSEYHAYLLEEKPSWCSNPGSLDEFLRSHASIARFGEPVAEEIIAAMQPSIPFPADLERFYRSHGWFGGARFCGLSIFSLERLHALRDDPRRYMRFHSMGLADSINWQWDNSREELDPASDSACYTREQIDKLNHDYQVVASWVTAGEEAHFYVYYDRSGQFGIVYHHQDDWESWPTIVWPGQPCGEACDLAADAPEPRTICTGLDQLLEASGANRSWDQVMNDALDWIEQSFEE